MPAGRPLKFESAEQLQKAVDAYFASTGWTRKEQLIKGDIVDAPWLEPAMLSMLAVHLGVDRGTLWNYSKEPDENCPNAELKREFFNILRDAKAKCDSNVEYGGMVGKFNPVIAKMNLVNDHGRKDLKEMTLGEDKDKPFSNKSVVEYVMPPKFEEPKAEEGSEI